MLKVESSIYTRKPNQVRSILKETTHSISTTGSLRIQVPSRYKSIGLATISDKVHILGICTLIDESNNYANLVLNTFIEISPDIIQEVQVDGDVYTEFLFNPNSTVIVTKDVVRDQEMMYSVFNEFFIMAKIPWFIGYDDMGGLFKTAKELAGSSIGNSMTAIEIMVTLISRSPLDRMKFFRHSTDQTPTYVALDSVYYTFTDTTAKLLGTYKTKAIVSALANPSTQVPTVEKLLRS